MHGRKAVTSKGQLTQATLPIHAGKGTAMLVLTRKADEQILIGDDIKITLVRVRGNSVRIGIDAPKSIRVVRGELAHKDAAARSGPMVEREEVFARPEAQPKYSGSTNRIAAANARKETPSVPSHSASLSDASRTNAPESFVNPAASPNTLEQAKRAPLSAFVSAT